MESAWRSARAAPAPPRLLAVPAGTGPRAICHEPLPPNVAYCDEFRPEFTLQACPITPKLEHLIVLAMRHDLSVGDPSGVLRCVVVLLRAREVKVVEMTLRNHMWRKRQTRVALGRPGEAAIVASLREIHQMYKKQLVDPRRLRVLVNSLVV